jgi:hypothetical protein
VDRNRPPVTPFEVSGRATQLAYIAAESRTVI